MEFDARGARSNLHKVCSFHDILKSSISIYFISAFSRRNIRVWTGENCNKVPPVKENLWSQTKPDMPDMSLETFCSLMTLDMMWPKIQPAWPAGTFCWWTVTDTSVLSCGCACSCPRVCLPAKVAGSRSIMGIGMERWEPRVPTNREFAVVGCKYLIWMSGFHKIAESRKFQSLSLSQFVSRMICS